jgi:hypothetical protein
MSPLQLNSATALSWQPNLQTPLDIQRVHVGPDPEGLGGFEVVEATSGTAPTNELLKTLHSARVDKRTTDVVVAVSFAGSVWLYGPDIDRAPVVSPAKSAQRQLQAALSEPDSLAAYRRFTSILDAQSSTEMPGVKNRGLFASYHLRTDVRKRRDWRALTEASTPLMALRHRALIEGLGFKVKDTVSQSLVLSASTSEPRAVALLLDDDETFESRSDRFQVSPVAWGLSVAADQGVPWLIVLRREQIRLYPARDGVGVGQKGQVETFFELDLAALDEDATGLLYLVFSAAALDHGGYTEKLLEDSAKYASDLGVRLRERVYDRVVPTISTEVARQVRALGWELDAEGLSLAYGLTLRILFRLLFQAYAEDRGLLPSGRNQRYDANSLKTFAAREKDTDPAEFGPATSIWLDLIQVWNAIDQGNALWQVPAYNGGLFGSDSERHFEGALIDRLQIPDRVLGPALQGLLIDPVTEDGGPGLVDFRSLSVREFGTIYEGLLESSLSVAESDLTEDASGAWVSAAEDDDVKALAGDPYFHSASGERKATGSYFTPAFVVDHLVERAIDPTLDAHLLRIKGYIDSGDEGRASKEFFDYRVADLAMGSGHFLVAAVDRIESKMRDFLSQPENRVPGVDNELARLAESARAALGRDEAAAEEIEPTTLLRRQVARRCIYGIDVNPLAVELSRLAIWIHTFVPGLPMSTLDHGLVCANSLTGIGTVEEAQQALIPNHVRGQQAFFDDVIDLGLSRARDLLIDAANAEEANKAEVENTARLAAEARAAAEPTRLIFDAAIAARVGLVRASSIFTEEELAVVARQSVVVDFVARARPAHMPYLFPEVFLRSNPGFDALIGNPPWEKLHVEEHLWWGIRLPGRRGTPKAVRDRQLAAFQESRPDLVIEFNSEVERVDAARQVIRSGPYPGIGAAHIDLYQAFAWRNWQLIRQAGRLGVVVPRGALSGSSLTEWRRQVLKDGSFSDVTVVVNNRGWLFESVHASYTVALTVVERTDSHRVSFSGPFYSRQELEDRGNSVVEVPASEFLSWSDTAAFPFIPSPQAAAVFTKMKKLPRFDTVRTDWEFRPIQGDVNASQDKALFDVDTRDSRGRIPVVTGSSFGLWEPDAGKPYGYAEPEVFRRHLARKFEHALTSRRSVYFGMSLPVGKLPMDYPRIAFKDVTSPTNTRSFIPCLLPPGFSATHKAPLIVRRSGSEIDEAFLLGVISSIPFDWFARKWVELSFSFEILNRMPVPIDGRTNSLGHRVAEIAGLLAAKDARFDEWAGRVNVPVGSAEEADQRSALTEELDAVVAHLYDLSEHELEHVFATFQRGWDYAAQLERVLSHFNRWKDRL